MAKNSGLPQQQILELVKKITGDLILEEKRLNIEQFKIICKNYLNTIDQQLENLQNRKSLAQRIGLMGSLMHGSTYGVQRLLIISHTFETALNNFLGRKIPLTWVSTSGKIQIASQSTTLNLYGSSNLGMSAQRDLAKGINNKSSYVGRIQGVKMNTFKQQKLDPELERLQALIDRSSENKRAVFRQSKRRYNNSASMSYASNPKYSNTISNIYWRVGQKNGTRLHWSGRIVNAGFIGEGYVALIINSRDDQINTRITFPNKTPPYDLIAQDYIRQVAEFALQGDSIPGIIQGDIKATDDGSIQLAIKQGPAFHAASIAGNVAIAYAFLYKTQTQLLSPETFRKQIQEIGEKFSTASWQRIFEQLTGEVVKGIGEIDFNLDII